MTNKVGVAVEVAALISAEIVDAAAVYTFDNAASSVAVALAPHAVSKIHVIKIKALKWIFMVSQHQRMGIVANTHPYSNQDAIFCWSASITACTNAEGTLALTDKPEPAVAL